MNPGHERSCPGKGSSYNSTVGGTKTIMPREIVAAVDGAPARVVLDYRDTAAAFDAGRQYGRAEAVERAAEVRAREMLLEQAGEWREMTLTLAEGVGPAWAEAMRQVMDS